MSIFPEGVAEKASAGNLYLSNKEFIDTEWIIDQVEIVVAGLKKYGAVSGEFLFDNGILKEGETIRYNMIDKDGNKKAYDSKGTALFIAFKNAEVDDRENKTKGLDKGDKVMITKEGQGDTTRYTIKNVNPRPMSEKEIKELGEGK